VHYFTHNLMRPVGMGVNETLVKLAESTRLIEELFPDLNEKINQELLNEIQARHYILVEGLQGKG
jgi:hypothetical protein